jgi:hypothetical protein
VSYSPGTELKLTAFFDGETVTTDGPRYKLRYHELFPKRSPRLLVGGNGNTSYE